MTVRRFCLAMLLPSLAAATAFLTPLIPGGAAERPDAVSLITGQHGPVPASHQFPGKWWPSTL